MAKQFSQKWTATAKNTPNAPLLCLWPARPLLGSTLLGTQDQVRQNSGDPSLPGAVAQGAASALPSLPARARASMFVAPCHPPGSRPLAAALRRGGVYLPAPLGGHPSSRG
jgi:hypothetical protein